VVHQNDCLVRCGLWRMCPIVGRSSLSSLQTSIVNAERRGKREVLIRPSSKVVVKFLSVMQRHGESLSRVIDLVFLFLSFLSCVLGIITTAVEEHPLLRRFNLPRNQANTLSLITNFNAFPPACSRDMRSPRSRHFFSLTLEENGS